MSLEALISLIYDPLPVVSMNIAIYHDVPRLQLHSLAKVSLRCQWLSTNLMPTLMTTDVMSTISRHFSQKAIKTYQFLGQIVIAPQISMQFR